MNHERLVKAAAWCLIINALLWTGFIVVLDIVFGFPSLLHEMPQKALPALLSRGPWLRNFLELYALVPLFLIPGSVGTFYALRSRAEGVMRIAIHFILISIICAMFGLMVWPGVTWNLATFLVHLRTPEYPPILASLFTLNFYFRVLIGEIIALSTFGIWTLFVSYAIIKDEVMSNWYGYVGYIIGIIMLIAIVWRMFGVSIVPKAVIELLPLGALWLFILGVGLLANKT